MKRSSKYGSAITVTIALSVTSVHAAKPWEVYARHIVTAKTVESLQDNAFGDIVNLHNGSLRFEHVDVDLKGNSALPVRFARSINFNKYRGESYHFPGEPIFQNPLGSWELELPRISATYGYKYQDQNSVTTYGWPANRCTGPREAQFINPFFPVEHHHGIYMYAPGGGELLEPSTAAPKPTVGDPYRWVTSDLTWVSCLPELNNGLGEGFLAMDSSGTKYWFNHMAVQPETWLQRNLAFYNPTLYLYRREYILYATRVEDRHGNWVTYDYINTSSQPARLREIKSNDGRKIDIISNTSGQVIEVRVGDRSWKYRYANNYWNSLYEVENPDGSLWKFLFDDFLGSALSVFPSPDTSCDYPGHASSGHLTGAVIHPSHARADYEISSYLHGRTNVPRRCFGTQDLSGTTYSDLVRFYWSDTLTKKTITGPSIIAKEWIYSYLDSHMHDQPYMWPEGYTPPWELGSWG